MARPRGTWVNSSNRTASTNAAGQGKWSAKLSKVDTEFNDRTGEDRYVVLLDSVNPNDIALIKNDFANFAGADGGNVKFLPNPYTQNGMAIKFPVEMKGEFEGKYLGIILDIMKNTGNYEDSSLSLISKNIGRYLRNAVTQEDMHNAENSIGDTWLELLKNLHDPEFRKKLLSYELSSAYQAKYGHVLSRANALEVLAQRPDASFVLSEDSWYRYYNRTVNTGAKRIIIKRSNKINPSSDSMDKAAVTNGFKSFADAVVSTKNSYSVNKGIAMAANKMDNKKPHFDYMAVYDVTDTTVIPGKPDTWTEEIGLLNNLNGTPNRNATVHQNTMMTKELEAQIADEKTRKLDEVAKKMLRRLKKVKIDFDEKMYATSTAIITNGAWAYAMAKCPEYNVLKQDNQERISAAVVATIAGALDLNTDLIIRNFIERYLPDLKKSDAPIAFRIYEELLPIITGKLNEGMGNENAQYAEFIKNLEAMGVKMVDEYSDVLEEEKEFKNNFASFMQRFEKIGK